MGQPVICTHKHTHLPPDRGCRLPTCDETQWTSFISIVKQSFMPDALPDATTVKAVGLDELLSPWLRSPVCYRCHNATLKLTFLLMPHPNLKIYCLALLFS